MKQLKAFEPKVKPLIKLAPEQIDLRTIDTNVILDHLDEQIRLREMPLEAHIKKLLKR
jgi:hypothetical protein